MDFWQNKWFQIAVIIHSWTDWFSYFHFTSRMSEICTIDFNILCKFIYNLEAFVCLWIRFNPPGLKEQTAHFDVPRGIKNYNWIARGWGYKTQTERVLHSISQFTGLPSDCFKGNKTIIISLYIWIINFVEWRAIIWLNSTVTNLYCAHLQGLYVAYSVCMKEMIFQFTSFVKNNRCLIKPTIMNLHVCNSRQHNLM